MVKKKVLPNGVRLVLVPLPENQTVTAMVLVEAGSNYEDKRVNGISHFLEHMCFKGTTNRTCPEITFELDAIGAESNAFTHNEFTGYYAKAHHKRLPKLIEVLSDIYLNSTFPEDEIEKEKGVIIEEINMYEDMPRWKVGEVFDELLYGDTPAGRTIIGPRETIRNMTRQDFVDYRAAHYHPQSTVVVIAGNFDVTEAAKMAKQYFGAMPKGKKVGKDKVVEKQKAPAAKVFLKKLDQTHLVLGWRTVDLHSEHNWALSLLATALGQGMSSRLFKRMRDDLGMCYYVRAASSASTDHGVFYVSAGVTNSRLKESVEVILEEAKKLATTELSAEELAKVKALKTGLMAMNLESSDSHADFFGFQELHHEKILSLKQQIAKINAVTAADIKKAAKRFLISATANLAVVGPHENEKELLDILRG